MITIKADKLPGLDVNITRFVSVIITEIINTILGSTAGESRPAEAIISDLRTGMLAITFEQDSEIDMNEGSSDSVFIRCCPFNRDGRI